MSSNERLMSAARTLRTSVLALLLAGTPAVAQTSGDAWETTIAPYLMGAGMNGTTGIAGQTVEIDASASDIFSNLQFGTMGIFVARKGAWGVGADAIWMALGSTLDQPPVNIDVNQGAFAFYGLRRLGPAAEVTFGVRWNVIQEEIDFKTPGIVRDQTKQWVDPLIGLNLRTTQSGRWHGGVYTEIGGFGAGSTFAWQVFPTVGINVGSRASLEFGYRWMSVDYESGEALTLFTWDVLTQGPVFGFAIRM
jgi:hypothetical protein